MNISVYESEDLGVVFSQNKNKMAGQDGAYSVDLNNGKVFWFFGDTLIGERISGQSLWYEFGPGNGRVNMSGWGKFETMLNNTGLTVNKKGGISGLVDPEYITDGNGFIRQLIEGTPEEDSGNYRIWCLDGITCRNMLYLYFIKIQIIPNKPVLENFRIIGSGIAKADRDEMCFRRVSKDSSGLFWENETPCFGSAVLKGNKDGWVYVYGSHRRAEGETECYISRVKEDEIENCEAYSYYDSRADIWRRRVENANPVMSGMPNEMSVSWNEYLGAFFAVHSLGLSGKIVGRTAPAPWGPWSAPFELWDVEPLVPAAENFWPMIYAGKEHPELSEDGGRIIYLTYIEFEEYYPHLIRVELDK